MQLIECQLYFRKFFNIGYEVEKYIVYDYKMIDSYFMLVFLRDKFVGVIVISVSDKFESGILNNMKDKG